MYQLAWKDTAAWKQFGGGQAIPAAPPDADVSHAAVFFWEEHCVECSAPQCYTACTLFQSRRDGRCARFQYGILPNSQVRGLFRFGADVSFRRWAKLETKWPAVPAMRSVSKVRLHERWVNLLEQTGSRVVPLLQKLFPAKRFNGMCTHVRRNVIRKLATSTVSPRPHTKPVGSQDDTEPAAAATRFWQADAFYLKCFSPQPEPFRIQIELVTDSPVFRTALIISPGWNEHLVDAAELFRCADGKAGRLQLSIENDQQVRLIFTWLDLVRLDSAAGQRGAISGQSDRTHSADVNAFESQSRPAAVTELASSTTSTHPATSAGLASPRSAEKVKCVAWDLDNTLWHGVIGDAGADGVEINEALVQLIDRLDQRGILQTIVSKNNYETAWPKIEAMGLADYFLFPAINWSPKSQNLLQIAQELNINVDSFAVVDDSEFERHEISSALPQVRVIDALQGPSFFERSEFDVPVTEEARQRRSKYLAEARRKQVGQTFRGDYDQFLRSCGMEMHIRRPLPEDQDRCLELIQRSNQFNLSGERHTCEQFQQLLNSASHDCYCFDVSDSFGSYGIVGFGAFEKTSDGPVLVEFVLSCRVAQKMVESTFFLWYARQQQQQGWNHLNVRLTVTPKNAPLRSVLDQLHFECIDTQGNRQTLCRRFSEPIAVPDVIAVHCDSESANGGACTATPAAAAAAVLPPAVRNTNAA